MSQLSGSLGLWIIALLLTATLVGGCTPEPSTPEARAVKARQANFKKLGGWMKQIDEEIKSGKPNAKDVQDQAQKIVALSADIPKWFPKGTGPEAGVNTAAKPGIWEDPERFAKLHREFSAEADKLVTTASGDELVGLESQYFSTGVGCANCHKAFRVKK